MERDIEKQITETMRAFGDIKSAELNPFFYTRLKARMEKQLLQPKQVLLWQVKPIYLLATACAVIIINILTFSFFNSSKTSQVENEKIYTFYEASSL